MRRYLAILAAAAVAGMIAIALFSTGPDIADPGVLVLEVSGELEESPATDGLAQLFARGPALATLTLQLEKAALDDRIRGVIVQLRPLAVGYARLQELRDAMSRVSAAGKTVVALLDLQTFNATRELYVASAADEVYVVPGYLGPLAGIAGQVLYLGGMFERAGVAVEYERIGAFKSAPESLAERGMSEPARENLNGVFDELYAQIIAGIAEGRGLDPDAVRALVDDAPATADEVVAAGLADGIADRSELPALAGMGEVEEVTLADYVQVDPRDLGLRDGPAIALVFGDGTILQTSGSGLARGGFGSDVIGRALEDAAEDERVRAIVLRINSPGGSSLASDHLWRSVRRARKHKPVVVSMADAAASGGYYVASAADAIVAEPATVTGSIGIFFQRIALGGLYDKLDIHAELIERGRFSGLMAGGKPLTPDERERTRAFIRAGYDEFLDRVSTGRGLPTERVDELGQGRVWLGASAREEGLVDEMGGLYTAVARAKREAGIPPEVDPQRLLFPGPRSVREQVRDLLSASSRRDLVSGLARDLLPAALPELIPDLVRASSELLDGELAYLPTWWIDFR
jgi:protease-4